MSASTAKPAPIRRWLQNLALSVGTFFLCIILFEILLRCLGYGNLEIYQPDAVLFWRLKPNQDCYTKIDHKPVHINSLGTRGPEFDLDEPAQTLRILSLGDSRTFGWGLSEAETYSGRLQQLLQQQFGSGKRVEVINAGVNAWSYPQMLAYFRLTGLRFHPDVVVLAGANLWTQFSENSSPEFVKRFMLRVQLKNLLRRFAIYHYVVEVKLKKFYEQHRAKFIPVDPRQDPFFKEQQQKDPDTLFGSAIGELCRLALTNHVKPLLLYLPILDEWTGTNAPAVLQVQRELNRQLGVPLVDMTPEVRPLGKSLYLEADPVHLNARGNEIVGRRLLESVNQLLTNEQASHH
jgi:lysophospholipase L1-like esterase